MRPLGGDSTCILFLEGQNNLPSGVAVFRIIYQKLGFKDPSLRQAQGKPCRTAFILDFMGR